MNIKPICQQRLPVRVVQGTFLAPNHSNKENNPNYQPLRQSSAPQKRQTVNIQQTPQQSSNIINRYEQPTNISANNNQRPTMGNSPALKKIHQSHNQSQQHDNLNQNAVQTSLNNVSKTVSIPQKDNLGFQVLGIKEAQLRQCQNIIKTQNEQIRKLKQHDAEKFDRLQIQNAEAIKEFQNDFEKQLRAMVNTAENDPLLITESNNSIINLYLQEVDRKATNLQNNVDNNINVIRELAKDNRKEIGQLCKNITCKIGLKIEEDENHFKQELDILRKQINSKVDKRNLNSLIALHCDQFKKEIEIQLQYIRQQRTLVQTKDQGEIEKMQSNFQQRIDVIEGKLMNQMKTLQNNLRQNIETCLQDDKEKQDLQNQLVVIKNKFYAMKKCFAQIGNPAEAKLKQLQKENDSLGKKNNIYKTEICCLKTQINVLEDQLQKLQITRAQEQVKETPRMQKLLTEKSFFSEQSRSTKAEFGKKQQKPNDISLDDFADYNENNLSESIKSEESDSCKFFYPEQDNPFEQTQQLENRTNKCNNAYSSPKIPNKKVIRETTLINWGQSNANKSQGDTSSHKVKMDIFTTSTKASALSNRYDYICKSIKRRNQMLITNLIGMLYINKTNQPLLCQFTEEGFLIDEDTKLFVIDDQGEPLTITRNEKKKLISDQMIYIKQV